MLAYGTLYGAFRRSAVLSTSDVIPPDQAFYVRHDRLLADVIDKRRSRFGPSELSP